MLCIQPALPLSPLRSAVASSANMPSGIVTSSQHVLSTWCQHAVPSCNLDSSDRSFGLPLVSITSCKLNRKENTTPFDVNFMRNPVLYRAAQVVVSCSWGGEELQLECLVGADRRAIWRSMQASMSRLVTASLPGLFARSDGTLPCSVKDRIEVACSKQSEPSE